MRGKPAVPWPVIIKATAPVPDLPGARCRPGGSFLDPSAWLPEADAEQHEAARHVCATCPVLAACREWVTGLPRSQRPSGIVAGVRYSLPGWRDAGKPVPGAHHGTAGAYRSDGCRCPDCRQAHADRQRGYEASRRERRDVTVRAGLASATALAGDASPRVSGYAAARAALLAGHEVPDGRLARQLHIAHRAVTIARAQLEREGRIEPWRPDRGPPRALASRAAAELERDHRRSNHAIGAVAGVSCNTVQRVRLRLEQDGRIGAWRGPSGYGPGRDAPAA